jgi:hypothetical protein
MGVFEQPTEDQGFDRPYAEWITIMPLGSKEISIGYVAKIQETRLGILKCQSHKVNDTTSLPRVISDLPRKSRL